MDQNNIQNQLNFYRNVFKSNCTKLYDDCKKFVDNITTPVLTSEKANVCAGDLVERELLKSLSSMQDCKSLRNDELTKKFYEYFWNAKKEPLMNSIKEKTKYKKLSIPQRQAVIYLLVFECYVIDFWIKS